MEPPPLALLANAGTQLPVALCHLGSSQNNDLSLPNAVSLLDCEIYGQSAVTETVRSMGSQQSLHGWFL